MRIVPIEDIIIPENRQRREFDEEKLFELRDSIRSKGLMHPIVVRNDGATLVAGERRLRAIRLLKAAYLCNGESIAEGRVPVLALSDLTPTELEEAELEENTVRLDLTWQERDAAIARLHDFRTRQAESRGEKQTASNTVAELLGRSARAGEATQIVSDAVLLNQHLSDPAVANAKSRREALNIVRKKLQEEHNAIVAGEVRKVQSRHVLLHGSCLQEMSKLPDELFDVICTDPPYGIGADKFVPLSGSESGQTHDYEDSYENAFEIWRTILDEGMRVCKPDAHLYMFYDFRYHFELTSLATDLGWSVWKRPIIWHKPGGGMLGDSTRGPRLSYECILYARKGDKRVTGVFLDTIIQMGTDTSQHAAAKPPTLIANLLQRSCTPGDHVLDPCCGSGSIFPAANKLSLYATGIEVVEKHYHTALMRLSEEI